MRCAADPTTEVRSRCPHASENNAGGFPPTRGCYPLHRAAAKPTSTHSDFNRPSGFLADSVHTVLFSASVRSL
jgi:hypothetical protein